VPLVGVHHMQAHALTPRLVDAIERRSKNNPRTSGGPNSNKKAAPEFPFATLLVSGGHTTLLHSASLLSHRVMADVDSIAVGDALDKAARLILPAPVLSACPDTMYARALEEFAFPGTTALSPAPQPQAFFNKSQKINNAYEYTPPATRVDEDKPVRHPHYDWFLSPPLAGTRRMAFNYSGLGGQVKNLFLANSRDHKDMDVGERRALARCVMRVAFEHLASRVVMMLQERDPKSKFYGGSLLSMSTATLTSTSTPTPASSYSQEPLTHLVVSGGVASNRFLMHVLRRFLAARGYGHVAITAPPVEYCIDNAAMIAWAGVEMYEAGWVSEPGVLATTQWSMDAAVEDGGILEIGGWQRRRGF